MVDIHSHVLPGLDDGARTLDESLQLLRLAADSGTTDIVATPHANDEFPFDYENVQSVYRQVAALSKDFINLHLGCDFHLSFHNILLALRHPERFTVNQTRYLMVELPDLVSLSTARTGLRQLLSARIIPVITHPERNPSVQNNLPELHAWRRDGCLLQITAQSLLGRFGPLAQRCAETLLNTGSADFIASDAHDCTDRTPNLSLAYHYVEHRYGSSRVSELFVDNPTALICGSPIPNRLPRKKSLWNFFPFLSSPSRRLR